MDIRAGRVYRLTAPLKTLMGTFIPGTRVLATKVESNYTIVLVDGAAIENFIHAQFEVTASPIFAVPFSMLGPSSRHLAWAPEAYIFARIGDEITVQPKTSRYDTLQREIREDHVALVGNPPDPNCTVTGANPKYPSNPYFDISRNMNVPYREVLKIVDAIERHPTSAPFGTNPLRFGWIVDSKLAQAVCDAYDLEQQRRRTVVGGIHKSAFRLPSHLVGRFQYKLDGAVLYDGPDKHVIDEE